MFRRDADWLHVAEGVRREVIDGTQGNEGGEGSYDEG